MKAKDTVMDIDNLLGAGVDFNKVLPVWLNQSLKKQAEVSFKAGKKEVAEWIKEHVTVSAYSSSFYGYNVLPALEWQAKLKEWGIE